MGIVVAVMQVFYAGVEAALAVGDGAFVALDAAILIAGPEALLPGKRQRAVADGNIVLRRNTEAMLLLRYPVNAGLGELGIVIGVRGGCFKAGGMFLRIGKNVFLFAVLVAVEPLIRF